jgi:cellulose synthase/poly-beta-1,6-N-acetylglucosamine synthase-like glycosyltransferase
LSASGGLILVLSRLVGNQWVQKDIRPTISIIVSAYNEEAVIKEKILNALALDYPKELLEVLVSSDGPTDR